MPLVGPCLRGPPLLAVNDVQGLVCTADKMLFRESASLNKPPLFYGQNYPIWCIRMKFFIQSLDKDIWNVISNNTYIRMLDINYASTKEHLNCIAQHIIVSALDSNELLKIS